MRIKPAPAMLCVFDMPKAPESFLDALLAACEGVHMTYGYDARTGMTRVTLAGAPNAVRDVLSKLP